MLILIFSSRNLSMLDPSSSTNHGLAQIFSRKKVDLMGYNKRKMKYLLLFKHGPIILRFGSLPGESIFYIVAARGGKIVPSSKVWWSWQLTFNLQVTRHGGQTKLCNMHTHADSILSSRMADRCMGSYSQSNFILQANFMVSWALHTWPV